MYRLPLIELEGALPEGRIIPAEQITALFQQAALTCCAETEAKKIVSAARRKAESIIQDATKKCREMESDKRCELRAIQRGIFRRREARWLRKHVIHLLSNETVEQTLVSAVSGRIHDCIDQVLRAWFGQQPQDETLITQLAQQAEQMANEGILTLRCHPDLLDRMREAFGQRFVLLADHESDRNSVVLSSSQLSVAFSPEVHFQQLLQWVHSACPEAGDQDENTGDEFVK